MKHPSSYLKMKILGAIEYAKGKTIKERIQDVAAMTFVDEEGNNRQYTWRTISTWYYRYKSKGITGVQRSCRSDKGATRKLTPEELLEAINEVKPCFYGKRCNKMDIYRKIIEKGILTKSDIAQTTFFRWIRQYELLKEEEKANNK